MSSTESAFGGMFRQLTELEVVEIHTEPLNAHIERRLKRFWEDTSDDFLGSELGRALDRNRE